MWFRGCILQRQQLLAKESTSQCNQFQEIVSNQQPQYPKEDLTAAQISSTRLLNHPCQVTGFKQPINKDLTRSHHHLSLHQGGNAEPLGEMLGDSSSWASHISAHLVTRDPWIPGFTLLVLGQENYICLQPLKSVTESIGKCFDKGSLIDWVGFFFFPQDIQKSLKKKVKFLGSFFLAGVK